MLGWGLLGVRVGHPLPLGVVGHLASVATSSRDPTRPDPTETDRASQTNASLSLMDADTLGLTTDEPPADEAAGSGEPVPVESDQVWGMVA